MRATVLDAPGRPLRAAELPEPEPGPGEVLLRVHACGVCRTDLHVLDGEVAPAPAAARPRPPDRRHRRRRPASASACRGSAGRAASAATAARGRENLCDRARFTGRDRDGGFAEYAVADARFCFPIPDGYPDLQAAPLLCAGLIGHRALRMAGDAERLGLYGFGAAAHIICQVARHEGRRVFAFTRAGRRRRRRPSRASSAPSGRARPATRPPEELDAAIIFAPAGALVPPRCARSPRAAPSSAPGST